MAASNAVLQTIVEENKRGRVMSFYTMAFFGMGPLGSLLAGCLAGTLGTAVTFLIFGMVSVAGSLVFAAMLPELRRAVRPIYIRVGILPDASAEVQAVESAASLACAHVQPRSRSIAAARRIAQRAAENSLSNCSRSRANACSRSAGGLPPASMSHQPR
jgi:MFS family permease